MSDTTGWKKLGTRTLYKNLPHCRIELHRVGGGHEWYINVEISAPCHPKPEAQRRAHAIAHAIAKALENVE